MRLVFTITGQGQTVAQIQQIRDRLRTEFLAEMPAIMDGVVYHIQRNELSGQSVQSVSGRLRDALNRRVRQEGNDVIGEAFIPFARAPYARILNEGGRTRAHIILPKRMRALRFVAGDGATVFATKVRHPGSIFRPRMFMQRGLQDRQAYIMAQLQQAANRAVQP